MRPDAARRLVLVVLALYVVALTFPGMLPFNRIRPLVLGLPFSLFWITVWVLLAAGALALLHHAETRADAAPGDDGARPPSEAP